jgi:hypothetical protein
MVPTQPYLDFEEQPRADGRPHVVDEAEGVAAVLVGEVREGEQHEHDGEQRQGEREGDEVEGLCAEQRNERELIAILLRRRRRRRAPGGGCGGVGHRLGLDAGEGAAAARGRQAGAMAGGGGKERGRGAGRAEGHRGAMVGGGGGDGGHRRRNGGRRGGGADGARGGGAAAHRRERTQGRSHHGHHYVVDVPDTRRATAVRGRPVCARMDRGKGEKEKRGEIRASAQVLAYQERDAFCMATGQEKKGGSGDGDERFRHVSLKTGMERKPINRPPAFHHSRAQQPRVLRRVGVGAAGVAVGSAAPLFVPIYPSILAQG